MLRIACDLDGTLADLSTVYRRIEEKIQGDSDGMIWDAIRNIDNFWTTLPVIEPGVIRRLYEVSRAGRWEVFFVTQRPSTAGESVQSQTQHWLIANGFERPSVVTLPGSRGKAAQALDLDFLIDDLPRNCVDVASDSRCRPLLVVRGDDPAAVEVASRFKFPLLRSVDEAIDLLQANVPAIKDESFRHRMLKRLGFG